MYTGRFAPSPTGPLHAGSLVAALTSWLDARAHGGRWLVRIEDVDTPRCVSGAAQHILSQLAAYGLVPDEPPLFQSTRDVAYQVSLDELLACGQAYPCACSRSDIEQALVQGGAARSRHEELIYPGTCRAGLQGRVARAIRLHTSIFKPKQPPAFLDTAQAAMNSGVDTTVTWYDRRLGKQQQDVAQAPGDFVLKRADGLWAYQLAVVVDDAAQGVTHVVRGQDLADNTARQIWLQRCLGLPTPQYLHTPLVLGSDGHKLSKQNSAKALSTDDLLQTLNDAAHVLGLYIEASTWVDWHAQAVRQWNARFVTL